MSARRFRRAVAVIGVGSAILLGLANAAAGVPLENTKERFVGSDPFEDCGPGFRIDFDVTAHFFANARGADGLIYFMENIHGSQEFVNLTTGKSLTRTFSFVSKDLRVTDNGDGTLTILVMGAGGEKLYGPDGRILFKDPGTSRFAFVVDHAGTPTDPSDDVFLEDLGIVKESTGRNDSEGRDFCEDLLFFTS